MGSSRFPGKPLATIHGIPMLGHVFFRSRMNPLLDAVYIATCDAEICRYAAGIGADCILTSPEHERASDRTAQAVRIIESRSSSPVAVSS
jgi:3-deoxy-manno-octulosonate cytidylyltransferase (CMP-KDO synthetase)